MKIKTDANLKKAAMFHYVHYPLCQIVSYYCKLHTYSQQKKYANARCRKYFLRSLVILSLISQKKDRQGAKPKHPPALFLLSLIILLAGFYRNPFSSVHQCKLQYIYSYCFACIM
jgi:hypothetical protein